jgi:hypothetical protein
MYEKLKSIAGGVDIIKIIFYFKSGSFGGIDKLPPFVIIINYHNSVPIRPV